MRNCNQKIVIFPSFQSSFLSLSFLLSHSHPVSSRFRRLFLSLSSFSSFFFNILVSPKLELSSNWHYMEY